MFFVRKLFHTNFCKKLNLKNYDIQNKTEMIYQQNLMTKIVIPYVFPLGINNKVLNVKFTSYIIIII